MSKAFISTLFTRLLEQILISAVILLFAFLIVGTKTAIENGGIGDGDVATWIQAISSVLALGAVFLAIERQVKRQRDLETEKENRESKRRSVLFEGIARAVRDMAEAMLEEDEAQNAAFFDDFNPAVILHYRDLFRGIPVMDIPSPNMIQAVTMLPIALANLNLVFEIAEGSDAYQHAHMRELGLTDRAKVVRDLATDILAHDL
ncbi:hypothetical protein J8I26_06535 [Herbaspirillum sp. LeCh32-8]|uniref:hypothetical protein n=1 Tax=Herbaspirillum sp. LeCh32-8 TaxID=2821356 RepID=UPI001AE679D6|nr:hypothetical protein [Herbaspirillum sp. LeCh32-8]MBP0597750.1 hypothetical protein [Herbaspirillum sp. LeCh32-8]